MTRHITHDDSGARGRCLTEFSVVALIAGALAVSAVLCLAIYVVL